MIPARLTPIERCHAAHADNLLDQALEALTAAGSSALGEIAAEGLTRSETFESRSEARRALTLAEDRVEACRMLLRTPLCDHRGSVLLPQEWREACERLDALAAAMRQAARGGVRKLGEVIGVDRAASLVEAAASMLRHSAAGDIVLVARCGND
ncbi:MAG: hypothetical protein F4017_07840 [Acidimicrobiaceae bacterium]|nr:hypothetical protein [Acidimicrobiaceae bacterium]MYE74971.1 hypothetical protein [Acidimicrobiaceae bacterium]MYH42224.1 hypothetical protein [Acidimicrobiaceae bacterium]MYJ42624.1 hypothetical protein [Acidimicrobiaceae bacterium]MYK74483.1 hypothetical protein [Acidimicrobiaceae bacterium]